MFRAQIIPLHNRHYFQTLMQTMERDNTSMIIDGASDLWHMNDMDMLLCQYPKKQATIE